MNFPFMEKKGYYCLTCSRFIQDRNEKRIHESLNKGHEVVTERELEDRQLSPEERKLNHSEVEKAKLRRKVDEM